MAVVIGLLGLAIGVGAGGNDVGATASNLPSIDVLKNGSPPASVNVGDSLTMRVTAPVESVGTENLELVANWSLDTGRISGASDVTAPEGWTTTYTTDGTSYVTNPANWSQVIGVKAVGSVSSGGFTAASQSHPLGLQTIATSSAGSVRPTLGNFQGGAAGDGWNAFHGDGKIFNIYHHTNPFGIDCHVRVSTGAKCWPTLNGSAFTVSGFLTGARSAGYADEQRDRVWGLVRRIQDNPQTGNYGFLCIDYSQAAPQLCSNVGDNGFVSLGTTNLLGSSYGVDGIGDLIEYDGRLYTKSNDANSPILCLDLSRAAACDGSPFYGVADPSAYVSPQGAWNINFTKRLGKRIYITSNQRFFDCFDLDEHERCSNSAWPLTAVNATFIGPLFAVTSGGGQVIEKVCMHSGVGGRCYDPDGTSPTTLPNLPATSGAAADGWGDNFNHYVLDRYYYTTSRTSFGCYDFVRSNICLKPDGTNWNQGNVLADYAYALTVDPVDPYCLWSNADNGANKIRPFNALTGAVGCAPTNPTTDVSTSTLMPQLPCSSSGFLRSWRTLKVIPGSQLLNASAARLAVLKDGQLNQVVSGWSAVAPNSQGVWDLSTLSTSASGSSPTFAISWSAGDLTGTSVELEYDTDPAQLCVNLTADSPCPSGNGQSATAALPGVNLEVSATATIGSAAPIPLEKTAVAADNTTCLGTVEGELTRGGQPVPDAVVTLMPANGSPIQVTTSAAGFYSIPRLFPGNYPIVFGVVEDGAPSSIVESVSIPRNSTTTVLATYGTGAMRAPDVTRAVTTNNGAVFDVEVTGGAGAFDPLLTRLVDPTTGTTVSALTLGGQPTWSLGSDGRPRASGVGTVGTYYAIYEARTSGGSTARGLLKLIVTNPTPSTAPVIGVVPPPSSPSTTRPPATTAPPTTRAPNPPVPITLAPGDAEVLPELPVGSVVVTEGDVAVEATIVRVGEVAWQMTGRGFQWQMQIPALGSQAGSDRGVVTLVTDRDVEISGFGFKGASLVDLWLFSTPIYIGTVRVDANGDFVDALRVPSNISPGEHTLQAIGVTPDGLARTLNLGVRVLSPNPQLPITGGGASPVAEWALWLLVSGWLLVECRHRTHPTRPSGFMTRRSTSDHSPRTP